MHIPVTTDRTVLPRARPTRAAEQEGSSSAFRKTAIVKVAWSGATALSAGSYQLAHEMTTDVGPALETQVFH